MKYKPKSRNTIKNKEKEVNNYCFRLNIKQTILIIMKSNYLTYLFFILK